MYLLLNTGFKNENKWLDLGEQMKRAGNKIYDVCADCGKIVQINKFLLGDMHLCTDAEERKRYVNQIRDLYKRNKKALENS